MTHSEVRVLLIEDNPGDARLIRESLRDVGQSSFALECVNRLAEGLERLPGDTDVILLDLGLPDSQGLDTFAAVHSRVPHIPIVVLTGLSDQSLAAVAVRDGAQDYLVKGEADGKLLARAIGYSIGRKQAEAEIRKLTLAVDQSPASVVITDLDGRIEYVNQRFTQVTGYTSEEVVGKGPKILSSGLVPDEVYRDLWRTIGSGRMWHGEFQNKRKDGRLYWDSVNIAPMRDARGAISHFVATQEDITERRNAEQSIRDREERFRQLADNIKEVFYVVSADHSEMLYISPAYEQVWGRTCQSLYDDPQSFAAPVPSEDQARLFPYMARVASGEDPGEIEYRVIRPDGEVRWVLSHAVPIRNDKGDVYRISGVALDITERRAAQAALEESESLYRKLVETSFDAILITVDGVAREANRGFLDMFGYTLEEVIGRHVRDFVADEAAEEVERRIAEHIEGTYELAGKRKDGKRLTLEATARMHLIGGRMGRLTALRDHTERRALEEQFRQAQKMEAVGRLAGGVAHDFNNLLTVITGTAALATEDLAPNDPLRRDLDQIGKAAEGAAALTRQLLAFSRQQVIQPRVVALNEVVGAAEKMLKHLIGEDVELVTALTADRLPVMIDPGQVEQVIMNLAVNARDAMPTGGKLTIETTAIELDEAYVEGHFPAIPGRFAMLAVSDTGGGMDDATKQRIFEPFFTTKELGKGTGLGLATVYGIVKQSGGFIWVYSEPGEGTTFKIYLPLVVDQAEETGAASSEVRPSPRGNEVVLVVEDAPAVIATVRQALERHGYTVLEAPNGGAALAYAQTYSGRIHLLLTDVVMPSMSGRVLAERFSALRPDVKVLYMSGYTDDAVLRHGLLEAGIAYLQKPFSPDALARRVREVLDVGYP